MQFLEAVKVLTDRTRLEFSHCAQKARKEHTCDCCNTKIEIGEYYNVGHIGARDKTGKIFCKLCNKCMDQVHPLKKYRVVEVGGELGVLLDEF